MATQLEEFVRQSLKELFKTLPLEKRLEGLTPEERLAGLSQDEMRAAVEIIKHRLGLDESSNRPG